MFLFCSERKRRRRGDFLRDQCANIYIIWPQSDQTPKTPTSNSVIVKAFSNKAIEGSNLLILFDIEPQWISDFYGGKFCSLRRMEFSFATPKLVNNNRMRCEMSCDSMLRGREFTACLMKCEKIQQEICESVNVYVSIILITYWSINCKVN